MRLLGTLLFICVLTTPTHQFLSTVISGITSLFGGGDESPLHSGFQLITSLADLINKFTEAINDESMIDISKLQEVAQHNLDVAIQSDQRLQEIDWKMGSSFEKTLSKLDDNARLIVQYSQALSNKIDNAYSSLSQEMTQHSKLNLELYSEFRDEAIAGLDYIAKKQHWSHQQIMQAHQQLNQLLESAFTAVFHKLQEHYTNHSRQMTELQNNMFQGMDNIENKQDELKKRIKLGFEESRTLFAKNENFLQDMQGVFLNKFKEAVNGIQNNTKILQKVRQEIKTLHSEMIGEFRNLEQVVREEIGALFEHTAKTELQTQIIIPVNETFTKMNIYIEEQKESARSEFVQAYHHHHIDGKRRYIRDRFKPLLEASMQAKRITHKDFEAYRDLFLQQYNLTNILYVFYNVQKWKNLKEQENILKRANKDFQDGLAKLKEHEHELRPQIAYNEFIVKAHETLRKKLDHIDDDWSDEFIQQQLTDTRKLLTAVKWSDHKRINDYVLFTTKDCDVNVSLIDPTSAHFLQHKNPSHYRFFLFRYQKDFDSEKLYDGFYQLRNSIAEPTVKNIIYDRISQETFQVTPGEEVEDSWAAYRNLAHSAVSEVCEGNCKVVLTTGNCIISADGPRKFAAMISPFKEVQIFVGF